LDKEKDKKKTRFFFKKVFFWILFFVFFVEGNEAFLSRHEICEKENRISIITRCFFKFRNSKTKFRKEESGGQIHTVDFVKKGKDVQYSTHTGTHMHTIEKNASFFIFSFCEH
jgi:hypothetical protein